MVCYFDGFGIGSDEEQRTLLSKIGGWMEPNGEALVDVLVPWYWAKLAGEDTPARQWRHGGATGRWDFDADQSRMVGVMWNDGVLGDECAQSMRCYAPADLRLLLDGLHLHLASYRPFNNERYEKSTTLHEAMLYLAYLRRKRAD